MNTVAVGHHNLFQKCVTDPLVALVVLVVLGIFKILPLPVGRKVGRALGRFVGCFTLKRNRWGMINLHIAFPEKSEAQRRQILKNMWAHFGQLMAELPHLEKVVRKAKFEGLENLQKAYTNGKGGFVCSAHFGNWEMLGAIVALLGYPLVSIVRHQNQGSMNRLINEYREKVGQTIAYNRGGNNLLQIVRMLKNKLVIGVIYDQDTNDIGVKLDLFGKTCIVPDGAASLSRMNQAPIVPIFIHNRDNGKFYVKIYPAHKDTNIFIVSDVKYDKNNNQTINQ